MLRHSWGLMGAMALFISVALCPLVASFSLTTSVMLACVAGFDMAFISFVGAVRYKDAEHICAFIYGACTLLVMVIVSVISLFANAAYFSLVALGLFGFHAGFCFALQTTLCIHSALSPKEAEPVPPTGEDPTESFSTLSTSLDEFA